MYPQPELTRLAVHKATLRRDIALRRIQCTQAAAQVTQPLVWLDRTMAFWRRLGPFTTLAAIPLGFLAKRALFPRFKILGSLLRWGPLAFAAARSISSAVRAPATTRSSHV